jgi:hypothetical protein
VVVRWFEGSFGKLLLVWTIELGEWRV